MNVRNIIFSALSATGLYLVALLIPIVGQAIGLFAPVPLLMVYVREGKQAGLLSIALAALLISGLAGWLAAGIFILTVGLMAIGLAEGLMKGLKHEQSVLIGGGLPLVATVIALFFIIISTGFNPASALEQYLKTSIAEAAKLYTNFGFREAAEMATAMSDVVVQTLVRLAPSIAIVIVLAQAACCYGFSRALMMKKAPALPAQPSFAGWHLPDAWVWGLIASLMLLIVPNESIKIIGWNFIIFFAALYVVQGLAVLEYALKKFSIPSFGRGLLFAVILAMPVVALVAAIGIIDIWADFRKLRVREQEDTTVPKP